MKWLVPLIFFVTLLPFVRRPWSFDDPSVIASAEAAALHPLTPHSYALDLGGAETAMWQGHRSIPAATHPPLTAWMLGMLIHFFGSGEIPLHVGMFLIATLGLFFAGSLARFFGARAEVLMVCLGISPALFLTALTLYPHLVYYLFYALTLYCVLRASENGSLIWGVGFGLSLTLAALSLYEWPMILIVAALFYHLHERHPQTGRSLLIGGVLFAAIYGAWMIWETHVYGVPHMVASVRARGVGPYPWTASILPAIFLSGALPPILIACPLLAERHKWPLPVLGGLGVLLLVLFASPWGGFTWIQAILLTFFFISALLFFLYGLDRFRAGDSTDRLLVLWFFAEFGFLQIFLVRSSGHHMLSVSIPASLLVVRAVDRWTTGNGLKLSAALLFLFTLVLAQADWSEARVGPALASRVLPRTGRLFFWGNEFSGLCYYLQKAGAKPFGPGQSLQPGDTVVIPRNLNTQGPPSPGLRLLALEQNLVFRQRNPWRTFSIRDSAGWYSASWGALPYSFSRAPVEEALVLKKVDPSHQSGKGRVRNLL